MPPNSQPPQYPRYPPLPPPHTSPPAYPPLPPYLPPTIPPPPRSSFREQYGISNGLIIFLISSFVVICLLCSVGVVLVRTQPNGASQAYTATATPILDPTETPFPTDTPAPPPPGPVVTTATMGGISAAFDAAYGTAVSQGEWIATIDGQQVQIMVDFGNVSDATDGSPRAEIVNATVPGGAGGWNGATSARIAAALLPLDARFVGATAGPSGATDENYVSQRLANSLYPSVFTTDDGSRQVTRGSVFWSCDQATGCYISIGTYN